MNIEILEFYPIDRNEEKGMLTGSLRIKLPDLGIHILGIFVYRKNDFWQFKLPERHGTHHQTGLCVPYPCIAFEDREKQKELIEAIREKGIEFVLNRIADTEKPLIFPPRKIKTSQEPIQKKPKVKTVEVKETAKKSGFQINKEYVDLPPLKNKRSSK